MEVTAYSTEKTRELAKQLVQLVKPKDVIALYGDLGSGKTTFVRYFVEEMGFDARVQSPTFIIHRKYTGNHPLIKIINHIDLYRINDAASLADISLEEVINEENGVTVIEWPEEAESLLPERSIKIRFEDMGETERRIKIENV